MRQCPLCKTYVADGKGWKQHVCGTPKEGEYQAPDTAVEPAVEGPAEEISVTIILVPEGWGE